MGADGDVVVLLRVDAAETVRSASERRADGRSLVVDAVVSLLGVDRGEVVMTARCTRCGGDHGRPTVSVAGRSGLVSASVSHAGGATAAAVARRPVGVDIEALAGPADRFAAIRAVSGPWATDVADGPDALRVWTTIEAVLKADGRGLEVDPRRIVLDGRLDASGTRASVDGRRPFYAVSSTEVDGLVLAVAAG